MSETIFAKRQSVRRYLDQDIPDSIIDELLEDAIAAPSAGNLQPWHFVAVKNSAVKEKLFQGALRQNQIRKAPVVIAICACPEKIAPTYGERGTSRYMLQDTAAAAENLLLSATAHGLGACWVGAFDDEKIRVALNLDASFLPVALITLGYPNKLPAKPARQKLVEVTTYLR